MLTSLFFFRAVLSSAGPEADEIRLTTYIKLQFYCCVRGYITTLLVQMWNKSTFEPCNYANKTLVQMGSVMTWPAVSRITGTTQSAANLFYLQCAICRKAVSFK